MKRVAVQVADFQHDGTPAYRTERGYDIGYATLAIVKRRTPSGYLCDRMWEVIHTPSGYQVGGPFGALAAAKEYAAQFVVWTGDEVTEKDALKALAALKERCHLLEVLHHAWPRGIWVMDMTPPLLVGRSERFTTEPAKEHWCSGPFERTTAEVSVLPGRIHVRHVPIPQPTGKAASQRPLKVG